MQDSCDWRYLAPTPISLSLFFFFFNVWGVWGVLGFELVISFVTI